MKRAIPITIISVGVAFGLLIYLDRKKPVPPAVHADSTMEVSNPAAASTSITMAWSKNDATQVGYIAAWGLQAGAYPHAFDVHEKLRHNLTLTKPTGTVYHFAVKAYNAKGIQSQYSADVPFTQP